MTGDQKHTEHIATGQRVHRHSSRPEVFYFFPHRTFLKTILTSHTNGTFAFAQKHQSQPFGKSKRAILCYRTQNKNNVNETHQNNILGTMNINREDILLEELIDNAWLSVRSINICKDAGLISLNRILDFYAKKGSFMSIRNCGAKTDKELIEICKKYLSSIPAEKVLKEQKESFLDTINSLTPFQKATLNRHFEYLVSNLNVRSYNGLARIQESLNPKDVFEKIFSERFDFRNIRNIGNKSVEELEKLKLELIRFVNVLQTIQKDQLSKEYTKLILKTTFSNLPENFEEQFENVFDENGKIKLFTLLNFLINSDQLFSKIQQKVFEITYTCNNEYRTFDSIAKDLNMSRERIRQVKSKLEEDIQNYFLFVSNLISDDLVNYNIRESNIFLTIDKSLRNKINDSEGVDFNINFYSIIFGIFLKKTHSILGDNEIIYGKRKTANQKKYENCYLIDKLLFDCFDFETFVTDIYLKVNGKISESYSLQFQGYLYNFLKEDGKAFLKEVYTVCEAIIFSEFDLFVDSTGYIYFERTTKKQVHEYCYVVLEEASEPMKIEQIANSVSAKFPDFNTTIDSLRGSLNREKELFIYFGRTSTYGLRKWESEKVNIKGGTIRELVEEYLLKEDLPKHISEIVEYVKQFRPDTNEKSVLSNIKVDESKKFIFFKKAFVGLANKNYNKNKFQEIEDSKSWNERFIELREFRGMNPNKWPSISSTDKSERALYMLGYKARKAFQNGNLNVEKEMLLRSIGFPLEDKITRTNDWKTEAKKLINFLISEKKWPSANSPSKDERALYRFCYLNKKAFQKNRLTNEQIEILKKMNFNFNILK